MRRRAAAALIVMAKAPIPGASKTRLCPPCTPEEAATLARAALEDTLGVVAGTPGARRVVALEGPPGPWLPPRFEVFPQRGEDLAQRLTAAFEDVGAPALAIAADIPQVTPGVLTRALALLRWRTEALLGPCPDGGYWAIGLRRVDRRVFEGVTMSSTDTLHRQRDRLRRVGLRWRELPTLRDVDRFDDAIAVASTSPGSRFATTLQPILDRLRAASVEVRP